MAVQAVSPALNCIKLRDYLDKPLSSPLRSKHLKHIQQIPTIKLLDIFKQILRTLRLAVSVVSVDYI